MSLRVPVVQGRFAFNRMVGQLTGRGSGSVADRIKEYMVNSTRR